MGRSVPLKRLLKLGWILGEEGKFSFYVECLEIYVINHFNLQFPYSLFVLFINGSVCGLAGPDHLGPPHCFLKLHKPLLVLVSLHQHPRHLHSSESLPLSHRYVLVLLTLVLLTLLPLEPPLPRLAPTTCGGRSHTLSHKIPSTHDHKFPSR